MNDEVIREFLLESHENLAQLDTDLLTLEKEPTEKQTLGRVFRTLHSIKGTAGFVGLTKLQAVAHSAESLLSKLRSGEMTFNQSIATVLLRVVDAIRQDLACIEASESEGDGDYTDLIDQLDRLRETGGQAENAAQTVGSKTVPPVAPPSVAVAGLSTTPFTSQATILVDLPPTGSGPTTEKSFVVESPVEPRSVGVTDSALRVDVGLLDKLMTLVAELVLARNQIMQFSSSQEDNAFLGTVQRLNLLTTELQTNVMKTRMQPIGNVWNKFPRVVRDLSVACGKQVRFEMEGQETELDKTIIEAIRDPLTHMIRNSVDHGIELPDVRRSNGKPIEGRLSLHAFHEGGKVIIEIADDGGGIDPQRVRQKAIQAKVVAAEEAARMSDRELTNLIFLPGFSTADKVTNFSGRGVGMDVVRTNIERIGGSVDIESHVGRGSTVRMKIPLTLAIIPALTISSGGQRYCIPQVSLLELVRLDGEQAELGIESIQGAPVYRLRGNLLPVLYLDAQLALATARPTGGEANIVVLQADDRQFGLVVDAIHDTEEIVVKPLQKQVKGISVFAGATIMGDGCVALILDVLGLAQKANVVSGARGRVLADEALADRGDAEADREPILVFEATDGARMAIPLSQVARLEEFPRSALERVGPRYVVQYRGEILQLIDLARELRARKRTARRVRNGNHAESASGTVQVVVYSSPDQRVGLVVANIVDIVSDEISVRSNASRPGVLFTAVIQGRVTEFLDVAAWIAKSNSPRPAKQIVMT